MSWALYGSLTASNQVQTLDGLFEKNLLSIIEDLLSYSVGVTKSLIRCPDPGAPNNCFISWNVSVSYYISLLLVTSPAHIY